MPSDLWIPSQYGLLEECLQPHNASVVDSGVSNSIGVKSVPLWEPSQNGRLLERPH